VKQNNLLACALRNDVTIHLAVIKLDAFAGPESRGDTSKDLL